MAKNWTHYATLNSPIIKCWYDALALIMQTGYEVSSLSVPVISHINDWAGYIGVATPFFICSRGSSTPFTMARGSTTPFFRGLK